MSKERYKFIGVSDFNSYLYDNKTKKKVDISPDEFCKLFNQQDQQISDLEAKLAESESNVKVGEFWHSAYQGKQLDYDKMYAELRKSYDENAQLKQQLAEKEKEIKDLNDRLNLKFVNYTNNESIKFLEEQDKISFAIEQLEKVKQWVKKKFEEIGCVYEEDIEEEEEEEELDNQIEELKKEMK